MQMGIGEKLFPKWAASVTLVRTHGVDAVNHVASAVRAPDGSSRLDSALRAATSFDHAIDATRQLPIGWFVGGLDKYYSGYEAARQAIMLLVTSGVVPGARERVGRQAIASAKDAFLAGVGVARLDRSKFGGHLASGWLDAALEDVRSGATLLRPDDATARALVAGVDRLRDAAARRQPVDEMLVSTVGDLFGRVGAKLDEALAEAIRRETTVAPPRASAELFSKVDALLVQSAQAAHDLVRAMPDVDRLGAKAS
jgi:hypothetical protein